MTNSKFLFLTSMALLMLLIAASLCPAAADMGIITAGLNLAVKGRR
ncbi:MAG: hypothetical protein ACREKQ_02375 [Candidatus Rokuibacteriota bacterium]